jgi:lipoate-protein ligase A
LKYLRLLITGPGEAAFNMALDQAIAEAVRAGRAPATIRFYGWERPAVSLGSFQGIDGINAGFLKETGIPIVKRPTGGRAILHGNELTYSVSSRYEGKLRGNLFACYRTISEALEAAIRKLGVPVEARRRREKPDARPGGPAHGHSNSAVCFQSVSFGEITFGGRKLVGSAQKRWTDGFLQQGSIPYEIDAALHAKVFPDFDGEAMAGLFEAAGRPVVHPDFMLFLRESFEEALGLPLLHSEAGEAEILRARELLPGFRCPLP